MNAPQSRIERRESSSLRAGFVRIAFALVALMFADSVFPGMTAAHWVFVANLVVSVIFQVAIHQGVAAGERRSFAMGMFDIAFLSYVVYLLGPASSVVPFVYLLIPVINATSSPSRSRVAMRLAWAGSLAYLGSLALVAANVLPYAPAHSERALSLPPVPQLVASGTLVVMSVLVTTSLVLRQMLALDHVNRRLSELSHLDELTALYNRRYLMAELRRQLERVSRGASCGVMMIDLDGFKRVNDEQGHDAGDLMLMDIANALSAETRAVDVVSRYGGDEFVVVLPDVPSEGTMTVAGRVVEAVARLSKERWPDLPVTASIGVTMAHCDDDVTTLLRRADSQAYAAKRAGGNRVSIGTHVVPAKSGVVAAPEKKRRALG